MNSQLLLDLQKKSFFKDCTIEEMRLLFSESKYRDVPNHKPLFYMGQEASSFAVVLFGGFKIVKELKNNKNAIMHFGIPGDLIGALFLTQAHSTYSVSVIAMGPSAALEVPKQIYKKNWEGNPKIQEKLQTHFFHRLQKLQEERSQTKHSLKTKIAGLLIQLVREEIKTGAISVAIPITRQEMADFVGASVESVIRNLKGMSNIITTKEKNITILDLQKLQALAEWIEQ